jgi:hypothetical protein
MTNHLKFAFHPIATPMPRTNLKMRSSRIILESALKWVVHPISSLVDLPPNAVLQLVTPPPTHIPKARSKKSWKGQFVKDHIVIPHHNNFSRNHHRFASHLIATLPISPVTNTNLSQRMRVNRTQSAFHHIVIPVPRIMKMMKVISRKTQSSLSKQTKRGSTKISAHIPKLSLCKNTLPDRTKRKTMGMMINQFVCHLFVYHLLNLLLFSFLVMRLRRMFRGKYLHRTPHVHWKLSLFIAHNYYHAFIHLYKYTLYIGTWDYSLTFTLTAYIVCSFVKAVYPVAWRRVGNDHFVRSERSTLLFIRMREPLYFPPRLLDFSINDPLNSPSLFPTHFHP